MPLPMTKSQEEFLNQMTRKVMVDICNTAVQQESEVVLIPRTSNRDLYLGYAITKGWVTVKSSDSEGTSVRINAAGWDTATRFLKR
jgi:hypothetical protein